MSETAVMMMSPIVETEPRTGNQGELGFSRIKGSYCFIMVLEWDGIVLAVRLVFLKRRARTSWDMHIRAQLSTHSSELLEKRSWSGSAI